MYFILEALIKQLIWAYAKTDICLEIDRGNKNRLCTLHAKEIVFSFPSHPPALLEPCSQVLNSVLGLQWASCQEPRGKQCACHSSIWESFCHMSPDKATLTTGQTAPRLYTWVFLRVPRNPLSVTSPLCCPQKYQLKNKGPLFSYCIAGLFYVQKYSI